MAEDKNTESTAIVKQEEPKQTSIANAKNLNDLPIAETAKALMSSGLVRTTDDLGKVFAKLSLGRDLGLPAVSALNGIHIGPNSSIILSAALMRLLINRSGRYRLFVKQRDTKGCAIEVFEKDFDGKWISMGVPVTFTAEDAKRAGLDKRETYVKWPSDMYYARALAATFRTYTPDCAAGCAVYLPEEIDGSGYKTDPISGDAVPEAEFEVVEKKVAAPRKVKDKDSAQLEIIRKMLKETGSDERVYLNHYQAENLEGLSNEQQSDLYQKLMQKQKAAKC
jgi:hypothetical protein